MNYHPHVSCTKLLFVDDAVIYRSAVEGMQGPTVLAPIYNDWIDGSTISGLKCKWNENNGLEALLYLITCSCRLRIVDSWLRWFVHFTFRKKSSRARSSENLHGRPVTRLSHFQDICISLQSLAVKLQTSTWRWLSFEIVTRMVEIVTELLHEPTRSSNSFLTWSFLFLLHLNDFLQSMVFYTFHFDLFGFLLPNITLRFIYSILLLVYPVIIKNWEDKSLMS